MREPSRKKGYMVYLNSNIMEAAREKAGHGNVSRVIEDFLSEITGVKAPKIETKEEKAERVLTKMLPESNVNLQVLMDNYGFGSKQKKRDFIKKTWKTDGGSVYPKEEE